MGGDAGPTAPGLKPVPLMPSEAIAAAYLHTCDGDPHRALVCAISDALADLCEAERRTLRRDRLVSAGYVRRGLGEAST